MGPQLRFIGVSFETVRVAITNLYFLHDGMTKEEFNKAKEFVVPMQHNYMNPIIPGSQDTWIQYWVNEDEKNGRDYAEGDTNTCKKMATVTLRFLGTRAEVWAKSFHHLTERESCSAIFKKVCNAGFLGYISSIVPSNIDYFKTGNTEIAFTLSFKLEYDEIIDLSQGDSVGGELMYVNFPAGEISK